MEYYGALVSMGMITCDKNIYGVALSACSAYNVVELYPEWGDSTAGDKAQVELQRAIRTYKRSLCQCVSI
jgi:hypothetical protein